MMATIYPTWIGFGQLANNGYLVSPGYKQVTMLSDLLRKNWVILQIYKKQI